MKQMPPEMPRTVNKDKPPQWPNHYKMKRTPLGLAPFILKTQGVLLLHPLFQYAGLACIWDKLKVTL